MEQLALIYREIEPSFIWAMLVGVVLVVAFDIWSLLHRRLRAADGEPPGGDVPSHPRSWTDLFGILCMLVAIGIMPAIRKVYGASHLWDFLLLGLAIGLPAVAAYRRRKHEHREALARGELPPGVEVPIEAGAAFFAAMGVIGLLLLAYLLLRI